MTGNETMGEKAGAFEQNNAKAKEGEKAQALVEARGLTKNFGKVRALNGMELRLEEGQLLSLVGPSGAGKTTFLRILGRLEFHDEGYLKLMGQRIASQETIGQAVTLRRQMAMVQQKPVVFDRSVLDNIALGLHFRGLEPHLIGERVHQAIKLVRLEGLEERRATTLSGGEAQRVAFARAIVVEPQLILLDEFTANLDPQHVNILEQALQNYLQEGRRRSALVVTHNLPQAKRLNGYLGVMDKGRMIELGPARQLFNAPENELTAAFLQGKMVY